jgi:hypothetical protein
MTIISPSTKNLKWLSHALSELFNPEDMPNVVKVQAGYEAKPLSAYLHQAAPLAAPVIDFPKINKDLFQTGFFNYLGFSMYDGKTQLLIENPINRYLIDDPT